jgi:hypothetical protein
MVMVLDKLKSVHLIGASLALLASAVLVQMAMANSWEPLVAEQCIHRQKHLVAGGRSPSGKRWTVTASVRNNGSCRTWLFSMDFRPSGTLRGSSRWSWRIPADGHLPMKFTINAQDESAGSGQAFYGAVGAHVKTIDLVMSKGEHTVVHPKLPPLALRKRFVWLRNVRYVLHYYAAGERVRIARLFDTRGGLIDVVRGSEGEFS